MRRFGNEKLDQMLRAKMHELHPNELTEDQREIRRLREIVNTLTAENNRLRHERSQGRFFTKDELEKFAKRIQSESYEKYKDLLRHEYEKLHQEHKTDIDNYWEKKYQMFVEACPSDRFLAYSSMFMQILVDVMSEEFGWTIPSNNNYSDMRYKICRLLSSLVQRCNDISEDDSVDIEMVSDRMAKRYGILFGTQEEE